MTRKYECELKFEIVDAPLVTARLNNLATSRYETYTDSYFVDPPAIMPDGEQELRVRRIESADRSESFLTFKSKVFDQRSQSKLEYETLVADSGIMSAILGQLGYTLDIAFTKECRNWHVMFDGLAVTATIASIAGHDRTFLELEVLIEEAAAVQETLASLRALGKSLGLLSRDECTESYTSIARAR